MKLAFAGFRHSHIMSLYQSAKEHPDVQIVAAAEDDAGTIDALKSKGQVTLTHRDWREMLKNVDCDAIAIGDYFTRRGQIAIAALAAGKHIIADKPLCTDLAELEQIDKIAREKKLIVSCLLDARDCGAFRTMRRIIREGAIGDVITCNFTAQHPLFFGTRPSWYFEPGKHGGTINDIAIHATDMIPWMTGRQIVEVVGARVWNARLPQHPHFQDCGQFMLRLDNNGGVLGDLSYLAPDGIAYTAPQYWRITCHGPDGVLEGNYGAKQVYLAQKADKSVRSIPADPDLNAGRIAEFVNAMKGKTTDGGLTNADVIRASKVALTAQRAADRNETKVRID
jgi:predicted dehydrogenase